MEYIPTIASRKENTSMLKQLQKSLQTLQSDADRLVNRKAAQLTNIGRDMDQLRTSVKDFRAEINSLLDGLERQTLTEIDDLEQHLADRYRSEQHIGQTVVKDLGEYRGKLAKAAEKSLTFVHLKQCYSWLAEKMQQMADLNQSNEFDIFQFHKNHDIEFFLRQVHDIGTIEMSSSTQASSKPTSETRGIQDKANLEPLNRQRHIQSFLQTNKIYRVTEKKDINMKTKTDTKQCSIVGICQLPDGCFMLSDMSNMCLKKLDSAYTVISRCTLSDGNIDICHTEESEVAVATGFKIQFVSSVGHSITPTRSFSTSHGCWYLAYRNKRLYVAEGPFGKSVYVYDLSGSLLHTISTDQQGRPLFSTMGGVQLSPDGQTLYVTDWHKGLVTLDSTGNLLATCQPDGLHVAGPLCVDGAGNVFVSGSRSHNVLQVTQEGDRVIADIVSQSEGLYQPNTLCFDNINCRLLVCCNSNTIVVISLKH